MVAVSCIIITMYLHSQVGSNSKLILIIHICAHAHARACWSKDFEYLMRAFGAWLKSRNEYSNSQKDRSWKPGNYTGNIIFFLMCNILETLVSIFLKVATARIDHLDPFGSF